MTVAVDREWTRFRSVRLERPPGLRFEARYRPTGAVFLAEPGSLEHWLTERYCLYSVDGRGRVHRAEIHHRPWPLQPAVVELASNELLSPLGLDEGGPPVNVLYARAIDVVVWPLRPA